MGQIYKRNSPIFLGNWRDLYGGSGYLGSFSVCFQGDDKKRSSTFSGKKCTPDKILATPMQIAESHPDIITSRCV